jgi:predicted DNA-binding transcriptional regulator AlpA
MRENCNADTPESVATGCEHEAMPKHRSVTPDAGDPDELLTAEQVCDILKKTPDQLYHMNRKGTAPPRYRIDGRNLRYRRGDLQAWLQSRRIEAGQPCPSVADQRLRV